MPSRASLTSRNTNVLEGISGAQTKSVVFMLSKILASDWLFRDVTERE